MASTEAQLSCDVAKLRLAIQGDIREQRLEPPDTPLFVVLSGLPGTGKSHFARALAQRVTFLTLGSDRLRKVLVPQPKYTRGEHSRVFAAAHQVLEELLGDGWRVIFDATNLNERFREPLYEMAERLNVPLVTAWFTAPESVIRRRLSDRAVGIASDSYSDADWEIYCRLRPGVEALIRPHLTVDSSQDIAPFLDKIVGMVTGDGSPLKSTLE